MNGLLLALVLFVVGAEDSVAVKEPCLRYEPSVVQLSGRVVLRTFAGPPNYESVAHGDRPETQAILELERPVCVIGDSTSDLNSEGEVDQLQVTLVPAQGMDFLKYDKETVRVEGELFHAHTGHHRTPLLLSVERIALMNKKTSR